MRHALLACVFALPLPALAQTVLYNSPPDTRGLAPMAADAFGNLYGTSYSGGLNALGTLYKLAPDGTMTTLYNFLPGQSVGGGAVTVVSKTIFGASPANDHDVNGGFVGYGIVFSASTNGHSFTVLHRFKGTDGSLPLVAPVASPSGLLYGVTLQGGTASGCGYTNDGVLYSVGAKGAFNVVHQFNYCDGARPQSVLVDASGNVWGTTQTGGGACALAAGCGTIFEYVPSTGAFTTVYHFTGGADGVGPTLGAIGTNGVLYGSSNGTTSTGYGQIWSWSGDKGLRVLHTFSGGAPDGAYPTPPTSSSGGNLYGTASSGYGAASPYGEVYQLTLDGSFTTLASLPGGAAPSSPNTQLVTMPGGVLAGTSYAGGTGDCVDPVYGTGCGTIYSIVP